VNGLTAAKGLRRSVEGAGGSMRISVPSLGDAFGRGKMTTRAKTGIEHVLDKAGVQVTPGLNDPQNDGWVTLRLAEALAAQAASPAVPARPGATAVRSLQPAPVPEQAVRPEEPVAAAAGGSPPRRTAPFLAAALAFLVPVLLVIALASPEANRPGRADAGTSTTSAPQQSTLLQRADDALLATDYTTAVRLTRQADAARVPALRRRIAAALTAQARAAQRERAYVRAIKLARRAARYGRAPGATTIVRQSRAGLDLRREEQRRAAREAAAPATTDGGPSAAPAGEAATPATTTAG
jgi:hypothetical protein